MGQSSSQIKPTQDEDSTTTDVDAGKDAKPAISAHGSEAALISGNGSEPLAPATKQKRPRESESEPSMETKRARKEPSLTRRKKQAIDDSQERIEVTQLKQESPLKQAPKRKRQTRATSENAEATFSPAPLRNVSDESVNEPGPRERFATNNNKRKIVTDDEVNAAEPANEYKERHTSPTVMIEQRRLSDAQPRDILKKPKTRRKSAVTQPDDETPVIAPSPKTRKNPGRKTTDVISPPRLAAQDQPYTPSNQQIQPLHIATPSKTNPPYVPAITGIDGTAQVKEWLETQKRPRSDSDRETPGRPTKRHDEIGVRGKPLAVVVDGPKAGPFTDEEKAVADAVLSACALQENISEYDLKCHIIDYLNVGPFKEEMKAALPNRTSIAIRKFCQRRYDLNTKGPWTEDEDKELLKAYTQYQNNWISISDIVGRSAQSCRDRYTNGLKYGAKRETGPWSTSEEAELLKAVEECIGSVKLASKADTVLVNDRSQLENNVAWNVVASKLGGRRSEKRCREKYAKLKKRGITQADLVSAPAQRSTAFDPEKFQSIEAEFETFKEGDLYDCLTEIHTAIKDHDAVYNDESTVWSIVSSKNPGSRFSSKIRRRAYHYAIENYKTKRILKATSIAGKARAVAKKLEKKMQDEAAELPRGYVPAAKKKHTKKEGKEKKQKNLSLSKEYISDSSDNEDGQADVSILDVLQSHDAGTDQSLASAIRYGTESPPETEQQGLEEEKSRGSTATSDEQENGHNFKRAQIATKSLQAHLKEPNGKNGQKMRARDSVKP